MNDQLIFNLPSYPALGSKDFFVSKANILAFEYIQNWVEWSNRRIIITGAKGSGKTHLSNVWANLADASFIEINSLEFDSTKEKAIIIENINLAASQSDLEENLLHILNGCSQTGTFVLMTSSVPPSRVGFELPDLLSRLIATEHISINSPDDALLSAVLLKHFNDRQIRISPFLIEFILKRITRSLISISNFVNELDNTSLKLGKGPSKEIVTEVLDKIRKNEE